VFGLFSRPIVFRAQMGQVGRPYIELPGIESGLEKRVLNALRGMGRLRVRSKSNDFGQTTVDFKASFESYSLHCNGGGAFIRGEGGGDEIEIMLRFMRKSRRFREFEAQSSR
jgi:hypothetical protein